MKTVTKELYLLEKEDVESALSEQFGREIRLRDVKCVMVRCQPLDTGIPEGAYLEFRTASGDECCSFDLFWSEGPECEGHFLNGKRLCLDDPWPDVKEIFAFDTAEFAYYEEYTDSSD